MASVFMLDRLASADDQPRISDCKPSFPVILASSELVSPFVQKTQVALPACVGKHALPEKLVFTHIVQRRGVTLGKHQVCYRGFSMLVCVNLFF